MSIDSKAEELKGKAKILAGKATDDEKLILKGRAQKMNAKAEEMLEGGERRKTDKHDMPMD